MRKAEVHKAGRFAGILVEDETGYHFSYNQNYLNFKDASAISLTLPLKKEAYHSNILFPFFDGLIPEGWLLEVATKTWKANPRDRMGLLLAYCEDCIGDVSIKNISDE